jgi:predicted transcriptional regulator
MTTTMIFNNSKQNRSRPDIVAQILDSARTPIFKTKLMYYAYITSLQTKEYLTELLDKGLLSYDSANRTYTITEQGKKYLRLHNSMKRLTQ